MGNESDAEKVNAAATFLHALLGNAVHVNDLEDRDLAAQGRNLGDAITGTVGHLATVFPNAYINTLMCSTWNLIGSRTTPVAMTGSVETPHMLVIDTRAAILFPPDWVAKASANPSMAMGSLVYCGSQAVDYWNGCITDRAAVIRRARAYEAEMLLTASAARSGVDPERVSGGCAPRVP